MSFKLNKREKRKSIKRLIRDYPNIEDGLNEGISQVTLRSVGTLTSRNINLAYKELLSNRDKIGKGLPVYKSEKMLKLLTFPENISKWNKRVLFNVKLINEVEDVLCEITNKGKSTLVDINKEILNEVNIGEDFQAQYKVIKLLKRGYNVKAGQTNSGKVARIDIVMTYRKGKV